MYQIDLTREVFSRRGSWWSVAFRDGRLVLRTHHYNSVGRDVLAIAINASKAFITASATPVELLASSDETRLWASMPEPKRIRLRCEHATELRIEGIGLYYCALTPLAANAYELRVSSHNVMFSFSCVAGTARARLDQPDPASGERTQVFTLQLTPDERGVVELLIDDTPTVGAQATDVSDYVSDRSAIQREWQAWCGPIPKSVTGYESACERAAYVNWSAIVNPFGLLKRPAMLMSKNVMDRVWSWDHCFNAMATIAHEPALGWDQFCLFFDHQDPTGVWPDLLTDNHFAFGITKPPIHGWALRWMMRHTRAITDAHLSEALAPMARQVDFWTNFRDTDGDGIPGYHHGCDSGWDNATLFNIGGEVESPDLSALLVIQMDVLAEISMRLGQTDISAHWHRRAEQLLARLIDHSWRNDHWISPRSGDHVTADEGDCLLPFVSIVLGERCPTHIFDAMVRGLFRPGRFLTSHGLATESPLSPFYVDDGYWTGPIWAPATLLVIDGLRRGGRPDLACDLARRFCALCRDSGFAENFDARHGTPLRDKAYTWTASVFLILQSHYLD